MKKDKAINLTIISLYSIMLSFLCYLFILDGVFLHKIWRINKDHSKYEKINICTLETNP